MRRQTLEPLSEFGKAFRQRGLCVCARGSKQYIKRDNSPTLQYFLSIRSAQLGQVTQIWLAVRWSKPTRQKEMPRDLVFALSLSQVHVCLHQKYLSCVGNPGAEEHQKRWDAVQRNRYASGYPRGEHLALKSNNIHPSTNRNIAFRHSPLSSPNCSKIFIICLTLFYIKREREIKNKIQKSNT